MLRTKFIVGRNQNNDEIRVSNRHLRRNPGFKPEGTLSNETPFSDGEFWFKGGFCVCGWPWPPANSMESPLLRAGVAAAQLALQVSPVAKKEEGVKEEGKIEAKCEVKKEASPPDPGQMLNIFCGSTLELFCRSRRWNLVLPFGRARWKPRQGMPLQRNKRQSGKVPWRNYLETLPLPGMGIGWTAKHLIMSFINRFDDWFPVRTFWLTWHSSSNLPLRGPLLWRLQPIQWI